MTEIENIGTGDTPTPRLLAMLGAAERDSEHPLGRSIYEHAEKVRLRSKTNENIPKTLPKNTFQPTNLTSLRWPSMHDPSVHGMTRPPTSPARAPVRCVLYFVSILTGW